MPSFYKHINTPVARNNFIFDKIYSNRNEMDLNAATDGVYIGRYVLVEYSHQQSLIKFAVLSQISSGSQPNKYYLYFKDKIAYKYKDKNAEPTSSYFPSITKDEWAYCVVESKQADGTVLKTINYFQCLEEDQAIDESGKIISGKPAIFTLKDVNEYNNSFLSYEENYIVDKERYANTISEEVWRDYDSTVWQKVQISNGQAKYIQVAELNTEVPTFESVPVPPTHTPGFKSDDNNTDKHYKFYVPGAWDVQLDETSTINENGFNINKNGFIDNPDNPYFSLTQKLTHTDSWGYKNENNPATEIDEADYDTKVLKYYMPQLGNAVANLYNAMYGTNRELGIGTLSTAADNESTDTQTLAGLINTTQKLLGRIVVNMNEMPTINNWPKKDDGNIDQDKVCYYEGKYYGYRTYDPKTVAVGSNFSLSIDDDTSKSEQMVVEEIASLKADLQTLLGLILTTQRLIGRKDDSNNIDSLQGCISLLSDLLQTIQTTWNNWFVNGYTDDEDKPVPSIQEKFESTLETHSEMVESWLSNNTAASEQFDFAGATYLVNSWLESSGDEMIETYVNDSDIVKNWSSNTALPLLQGWIASDSDNFFTETPGATRLLNGSLGAGGVLSNQAKDWFIDWFSKVAIGKDTTFITDSSSNTSYAWKINKDGKINIEIINQSETIKTSTVTEDENGEKIITEKEISIPSLNFIHDTPNPTEESDIYGTYEESTGVLNVPSFQVDETGHVQINGEKDIPIGISITKDLVAQDNKPYMLTIPKGTSYMQALQIILDNFNALLLNGNSNTSGIVSQAGALDTVEFVDDVSPVLA